MTQLREFRRITLALLVVTTVVILPGFLDVTNLPKLLVLIAGAAMLIALLAREGAAAAGSPFVYWLPIAFIVGMVVSASLDGQHLYRVLYGVWGRNDGLLAYASMGVVFASIASAFRGRAARLVLFTLAGTGVVEAVFGLAQHLAGSPGYWAKPYNPVMGTFGNPDFASAFLGIAAVALCAIGLMPDVPRGLRLPAFAAGVAAAALTVLSQALQGTLAFCVGSAVAVTAWAFNAHAPASLRVLRFPLLAALSVGGVAGVVGLADRGPFGTVLQSANLADRFYLWRAALAMFRAHPWFGVGIDSYAEQFRLVRGADLAAGGGIGTTADAAHSVPLNLLAAGGLVVLVPYLLIVAFVAWRGIRTMRITDQPLVVAALLGSWAAYVAASCFSLDQLGVAVWGWALGGAIVGASYPVHHASGHAPVRLRLGSASVQMAVGLLAIALLAWPLRASSAVLGALNLEPSGAAGRAAAITALSTSGAQAPDPTLCQFAVYRLQDIAEPARAIALAQQCVVTFPNRLELWEPIADGLEQRGDRHAAIAARQRTVALDPRNQEFKRLLAQDLAAS